MRWGCGEEGVKKRTIEYRMKNLEQIPRGARKETSKDKRNEAEIPRNVPYDVPRCRVARSGGVRIAQVYAQRTRRNTEKKHADSQCQSLLRADLLD